MEIQVGDPLWLGPFLFTWEPEVLPTGLTEKRKLVYRDSGSHGKGSGQAQSQGL